MSGSGYFARLRVLAGGGAAHRPAPRARVRPEPLEQEEVRVAPASGPPSAPADAPPRSGPSTAPVPPPSPAAPERTTTRAHRGRPGSPPPAVSPPPPTAAEGPAAPRREGRETDRTAAAPVPAAKGLRVEAPKLPTEASAPPPPTVPDLPDDPPRATASVPAPKPATRKFEAAVRERPGPAPPASASAPRRAEDASRRVPAPDEGFHEALVRVRRWMAEPEAEAETDGPPSPAPELPPSPASETRGGLRRVLGRIPTTDPEPAAPVEQRTEVSIGTIQVTVEEPDGAPHRAGGRPAPAAAPARPPAVPRHYVRGW